MQTVLLTGGSGYIGTHTCLTLLKSGFNVIVIDSNINSKKIALTRVFEIFFYINPQLKIIIINFSLLEVILEMEDLK